MLPLSIASGWGDPPGNWTALWLIGVFATSIGLPFFTLAANNPLLQAWFVRTGHVDGRDPYFLYAASNIGSFLALLSYPFILEPTLSLRQHILLWSGGYWLLFVLIVACGYLLLRSPARFEMAEGADAPASPAPTWLALGRWAFIAFVPSGLLVAVTAYISTSTRPTSRFPRAGRTTWANSPSARSGSLRSPIPRNGCGPTIIRTSSAPSPENSIGQAGACSRADSGHGSLSDPLPKPFRFGGMAYRISTYWAVSHPATFCGLTSVPQVKLGQ
jgi:hypothetical protein